MYKSRAKEWARALRSGKYPQAYGTLCKLDANGNIEGFCCLGVLCELAVKDGAPVEVRDNKESYFRNYSNQTGHLPNSVMSWAGLTDSNPVLVPGKAIEEPAPCNVCGGVHGDILADNGTTASHANDNLKMTFAEIADAVEKTFLGKK